MENWFMMDDERDMIADEIADGVQGLTGTVSEMIEEVTRYGKITADGSNWIEFEVFKNGEVFDFCLHLTDTGYDGIRKVDWVEYLPM